jgi:hypothetical protein
MPDDEIFELGDVVLQPAATIRNANSLTSPPIALKLQ